MSKKKEYTNSDKKLVDATLLLGVSILITNTVNDPWRFTAILLAIIGLKLYIDLLKNK